jgi:hypothetical protein
VLDGKMGPNLQLRSYLAFAMNVRIWTPPQFASIPSYGG